MKERFLFIPNRRFWLVLTFIFGLFLLTASVVAAQDSGYVIPPDVMTPDQAGQAGINLVLSIVAAFGGSILTAAIVSLLKLFVPDTVDAGTIKNVVALVLTVLYWLAVRYGFGEAFTSIANFLVVIIPAGITLYGSFIGSSMLHQQAVAHNAPVLGYQRTPFPQLE